MNLTKKAEWEAASSRAGSGPHWGQQYRGPARGFGSPEASMGRGALQQQQQQQPRRQGSSHRAISMPAGDGGGSASVANRVWTRQGPSLPHTGSLAPTHLQQRGAASRGGRRVLSGDLAPPLSRNPSMAVAHRPDSGRWAATRHRASRSIGELPAAGSAQAMHPSRSTQQLSSLAPVQEVSLPAQSPAPAAAAAANADLAGSLGMPLVPEEAPRPAAFLSAFGEALEAPLGSAVGPPDWEQEELGLMSSPGGMVNRRTRRWVPLASDLTDALAAPKVVRLTGPLLPRRRRRRGAWRCSCPASDRGKCPLGSPISETPPMRLVARDLQGAHPEPQRAQQLGPQHGEHPVGVRGGG